MDVRDAVVLFLVEGHSLDVVKHAEKVGLDGVRVRRLSEDLQQSRVRDKEEARKDKPLLLEVASEGLLAQLQLLQEVWQQLPESLVSDTALDDVGSLVSLGHDLHPGLVNVLETFGFLEERGSCNRAMHKEAAGSLSPWEAAWLCLLPQTRPPSTPTGSAPPASSR